METSPVLVPITQRKIRDEPMGKGHLRIHSVYVDGKLVGEAFTLESLAHVLDLPMSTMDGRYKRGRLHHWKVDVYGPSGRPARAFPLAMLEQVIAIITTRKAYVQASETGTGASTPSANQVGELRPTGHAGKNYYTVPALAEAFGYSETTIRNRLKKSGLMRHMVNLSSPAQGGRPQRGIAASLLPQITLAITEGAQFSTALDQALARGTGALERAAREAQDMFGGSLVNAVNPPARTVGMPAALAAPYGGQPQVGSVARDLYDMTDVMAEIESAVARGQAAPARDVPPPPVAQDDEAATRASMVEPARQAMIDQDTEPTAQEFDDMTYALGLDAEATGAFIHSVRTARQGRVVTPA